MSDTQIVRAKDVMQKGLTYIDGMDTAKEAAATMRNEHVTALVVNKRNPDDVWGIIAIQDLIKGVIVPDRASDEVNVYEIMTKPIITVPADMDIKYVARLIYRAGIRRAPVEENGELIGMISLASLVLNNELF
ncbi:MAG: CBS domain-containing protein [Thermodesulfovibrionales bacterium]|nr:CBS domain-containing protein [Thermodesulfovibrionales bacterium]